MIRKGFLKLTFLLILAINVHQNVPAQPWITYNTGNGLANNFDIHYKGEANSAGKQPAIHKFYGYVIKAGLVSNFSPAS